MKKTFYLASLCLFAACGPQHNADNQGGEPIKVNQVGYYPDQQKIAVIEDEAAAETYYLFDAESGRLVWQGQESRTATSEWSGKQRHIVDFSSVTTPGSYLLDAGTYSRPVEIRDNALNELSKASLKAFYYQRTGIELTQEYAGQWARPAGHPDTEVLIHPSAVSPGRKAGTVISSPAGWYDAGDYNKYVVNSGFSVGAMLCGYEMNRDYYDQLELNIPESGNATPDILDELYFNLKWMITMQDPADGGVYHKLTTPNFEGFLMPTDCHQQRYVVQKTTTAALDYAANLAQASRLYAAYPEYAQFAADALKAAEKAWQWAVKHPAVPYHQNEMNQTYAPAVNTGAYDDEHPGDEFFWAATELYLTTGQSAYLDEARNRMPQFYSLPSWGNVTGLALLEWLSQDPARDEAIATMVEQIKPMLLGYCDGVLQTVPTSCYQSPYGNSKHDFGWGALAEACCMQGVSLLYAHQLTGDSRYLQAALQNADALLGRNATGYCFVTGFGQKSPMHPHHRLSHADGIEAPIPGLLVGGPNPGQQDRATCPEYPSAQPDESYLDDMNSYASNEIAINWNASLAMMIGWLDASLTR